MRGFDVQSSSQFESKTGASPGDRERAKKAATVRKHYHSTHFSAGISKCIHLCYHMVKCKTTKKNEALPNFFIFIFIRVRNLYSSFDKIKANTQAKGANKWQRSEEVNEDKIKNHILFDTWNITFLICALCVRSVCVYVCGCHAYLFQSFNL